jgi:hypothetical protein
MTQDFDLAVETSSAGAAPKKAPAARKKSVAKGSPAAGDAAVSAGATPKKAPAARRKWAANQPSASVHKAVNEAEPTRNPAAIRTDHHRDAADNPGAQTGTEGSSGNGSISGRFSASRVPRLGLSTQKRSTKFPIVVMTAVLGLAVVTAVGLVVFGSDAELPAVQHSAGLPKIDYVQELSTPPGVEVFEGARSDVSGLSCTSEGENWLAQGSVTNSAAADRAYRIYVAFLTDDGVTAGLVQTNVALLAPATTSRWSAQLLIPSSEGLGLRCVLRVERHNP